MSLIYEEKTEVVRRCLFDVQNEVGIGRDEEDYHQALRVCFAQHGVPAPSKHPHPIYLYGLEVHKLFPDFIPWDQITFELKAVPRKLGPAEYVQLFDYLKCRRDRLGLLANMGLDRVFVDRVAYVPVKNQLLEDWSYWSGKIDASSRKIGLHVRQALRDVFQEHTTGYGDEVTRKLILFALEHHGLSVVESPVAESRYESKRLRESPLDCLLIEQRIVLCYTCLFDNNNFNMNRCRSFLRALGLQWGIAANFGKTNAQFAGMRSIR